MFLTFKGCSLIFFVILRNSDVGTMDVYFVSRFSSILGGISNFEPCHMGSSNHFGVLAWLVTEQAWEPSGLHTRLFREDEVLRGVPC